MKWPEEEMSGAGHDRFTVYDAVFNFIPAHHISQPYHSTHTHPHIKLEI